MTDISKEAVERDCKSMRALSHHILVCFQADRVDAENVARVADCLEALSARVQELESQTHDQFKASFDRGVLLGLDKAAELAFEYPAEKHGSLDTDPFKAARQATYEVGLAIEALKGDPQ